ncbi:Wzy polymerase domain-containing protein [Acinetobacter baumannii]|uniref:O-antigen ligase C-terminal domain-containing protein n=3 Tax=Acinetobacter baumannii TaxID=470 RepID=A0AAP1W5J0_ACIBA|nr:O-antigen ligase family protein [Acinetobacter baumannii]MBD2851211.1 O-antigen ligase C-terminal domain-containing protein [Acinetobacter baumannii]MBD3132431.1 O-antigen ligase C-terminal domain-containing protein [Acinetobacter baumannii]MBE0308369.1 O-antigen ligase C-terminal domain-containing protein [Acinetobacter baumannii]MBE0311436.1 O-antigen ligase C-terminal domain-containing protein [Acinetobacter baumannii]MBE0328714.1 O-antigen ligase C-terminal domain-containing protein [Ac
MQVFFLFLAAILLGSAWLSPFHYSPWVMFSSEVSTFGAGLCVLISLLQQNIKIPRAQILLLPFTLIPIVQWGCGLVFDLSTALLSTFYLLGFWFMVLAGYNLSLDQKKKDQIFSGFSLLVIITSLLTSLIAIFQWLNIESHLIYTLHLIGNRPYGNFGQPNNMATFLIIGLLGCLYLYEKNKVTVWLLLPSALIILFTIALSQSRTSWIVFPFLLIYWIVKQFGKQKRFRFVQGLLWCLAFFLIAGLILPYITQFIEFSTNTEITETSSFVARAGSGHERIGMWIQILHAIAQQPWLGYGWSQTSVAVVDSIQYGTVHVWFNSAHNVLLDIIIWNGIPIGIVIIAYFACWFVWLNQQAKETISIIAIMMVCTVLIHAMLEFPQRYAYFLLTCGFLLGIIQAQTPILKGIVLNKQVLRLIWGVSLILLLAIWRDYNVYVTNSNLLFKNKQPNAEVLGSNQIFVLTQFEQRLKWIEMKPETTLSDADLAVWGNFVKNKATPYNLRKYAQLLAYNGKVEQAEQQIFILQHLYRQQITLAELLKNK